MKKPLFYVAVFLFCAVSAAAQGITLPEGQISALDIRVEILGNIAVTRYDIALENNTRSTQLVEEEELKNEDGNYLYSLQLNPGRKIPAFRLRIDAVKQELAPEIKESAFNNLQFIKRGDSYFASFRAKDYKSNGSLTFAVPAEDAVKAFTFDEGSDTYFFAIVPVPKNADGLKSITYDKSKFEEIYPNNSVPARDMLVIAGILSVKEASLDLNFTNKGKPFVKKRIYINKKNRSDFARRIVEQYKASAA